MLGDLVLLCSCDESPVLLLGEVTPHSGVCNGLLSGKDIYPSQPMALFVQQFPICFASTIVFHFSVWVVVGSVFFSFLFPLKI